MSLSEGAKWRGSTRPLHSFKSEMFTLVMTHQSTEEAPLRTEDTSGIDRSVGFG
jgi:hypothetical protein